MCTDLEGKFPHTTVYALNREISDHTPLLVNTGELSSTYQPQFKFELGWLLRESFMDMVTNIWHNTLVEGTTLQRWQTKIRKLRQYLRGWAKHISGHYKKKRRRS